MRSTGPGFMRQLRQIPTLIFSLALVLTLAACGGSSESDNDSGKNAVAARGAVRADLVPQKSAKRGVAYGGNSAADLTVLSKGISWWYNWSPTPEAGAAGVYKSLGVDFVPMAWGGTPTVDQLSSQVPDGGKYLLGFNEPNFKSQSDKTPSQAAALWPVLQEVAKRKGLQLGAPAVNYCGDCVSEGGVTFTDPVAYMDAFFAACQGCQIDYIPVHWYACDVSALKSYIDRFRKYGKPLWVTEFACGDNPHDSITLAVQKNYMTAAVNYLENEPIVARYSWFSGRNSSIPNVNLLGADGQLTELGQLYVSLPFGLGDVQLTPLSASASASENADTGPAKAIDNNLGTRWSSGFTDQQWLTLDFGASVNVTHVRINWENAHASEYQLQTSQDGLAWTTIKSVTGSNGGIEDITGLSGSGRYLRMNGVKRSTPYGYSIYEIAAWGSLTPAPQGTVRATASSSENADLGPEKAIDKNAGTRWSSGFSDAQWITLDFGAVTSLSRVRIDWENAHATEYQIQVSNDNANWTTIKSITGSNGGVEDFPNLSASGRYLRINGLKRSTPYGYSIYEIETWGGDTSNPVAPPQSTDPVALTAVAAAASGSENGGLGPEKAIDKNIGTRWSSAFNDAQWITLDFGGMASFSRVRINWENAHASEYQIQVSSDNVNWSLVKSVTGSNGGVEDFSSLSASGRYLRINGVKRSSQYGYSIFEIETWGTPPTAQK
ncbi:discoidin domain-containing protein [Undibacterium sp. TJN25]|uniref:discoidin domain-containing protein n=1 Tax=Undibacterium sp. TJN25 TaxID=3413056 RepID=UPI003BF0937D